MQNYGAKGARKRQIKEEGASEFFLDAEATLVEQKWWVEWWENFCRFGSRLGWIWGTQQIKVMSESVKV